MDTNEQNQKQTPELPPHVKQKRPHLHDREELRSEMVIAIRHGITADIWYFLPLLVACVIATLGLLMDNATIVIGAMLIAPLFWPLVGIATGMLTMRGRLLEKSIRLLIFSVALVVGLAALLSYILPLDELTSEIESRINPTILDLIIALASSIVGVVALYWPHLSQTIAGVAMAVSLLPPLCTAGIGIALKSWHIFSGAMLLFAANMGAIVFAGIIVLLIIGFRPRFGKERRRLIVGLILSVVFIVGISFPLLIYLKQAISRDTLHSEIQTVLQEEIETINNGAKLEDVATSFQVSGSNTTVIVRAEIHVPEGTYLTLEQKNSMTHNLQALTDNPIDLKLDVIRSLSLRIEQDEEEEQLLQDIETMLSERILQIVPDTIIESIDIELPEIDVEPISIKVLLRQPSESQLTYEDKTRLAQELSDHLEQDVALEVEITPVTTLQAESTQNKYRMEIQATITEFLEEETPLVSADEIDVTFSSDMETIAIELTVIAPLNTGFSASNKKALMVDLENNFDQTIGLKVNVIPYTGITKPEPEPEVESAEEF